MIHALQAFLALVAARIERLAAELSEDAKRYPNRQFYRGYEQGLRDGLTGAEHAKQWLSTKEGAGDGQ